MSLTESEKREVKYKLKRADHGQALEFLDTLGFNPTADKIFEKMWEERQPSCEICGDEADKIKYGKTPDGIQRYKCKECGETFSERVNMPFNNSPHSVSKWKAFFEQMIKGDTLTELSRQFNIARTTAHDWRHQLLSTLRHIQGEKWLAGRVWADETKVPVNKIGRGQPGGTGHYSVMTIKDYKGRTVLVPVSREMGSTDEIKQMLDNYLVPESSTLVTDGATNVGKFCRNRPIGHDTYDSESDKMKMVNWLHSHFKEWLSHFRGVGHKLLRNYCAWFAYIHENDQLEPNIAT